MGWKKVCYHAGTNQVSLIVNWSQVWWRGKEPGAHGLLRGECKSSVGNHDWLTGSFIENRDMAETLPLLFEFHFPEQRRKLRTSRSSVCPDKVDTYIPATAGPFAHAPMSSPMLYDIYDIG